MTNSTIDKIKLWIFPSMVSLIGLFIYQEMKEIKSDVKALLAQSNIDKTRIDNLEREIYGDKLLTTSIPAPIKHPPRPLLFLLDEYIPAKNDTDDDEEDYI